MPIRRRALPLAVLAFLLGAAVGALRRGGDGGHAIELAPETGSPDAIAHTAPAGEAPFDVPVGNAKSTPKELCALIERRNRNVIVAAQQAFLSSAAGDADIDWFQREMGFDGGRAAAWPLDWCEGDEHGVWAYFVHHYTVRSESSEAGLLSVGFVRPGATPVLVDAEFDPGQCPSVMSYGSNVFSGDSGGCLFASDFETFDFDGDGFTELFYSWRAAPYADAEERSASWLTYRDGRIEPFFAEGATGTPHTLKDLDGDGRPDAVYVLSDVVCNPDHPDGKCVRSYHTPSVARSKPDGTFEHDEGLAERYVP